MSVSEEINRIIILLEDAKEENDWDLVNKIITEMDLLYEATERLEQGYEESEYN